MRRTLISALSLALVFSGLLVLGQPALAGTHSRGVPATPMSHRQALRALEAGEQLLERVPARDARATAPRPIDGTAIVTDLVRARPSLTNAERARADRVLGQLLPSRAFSRSGKTVSSPVGASTQLGPGGGFAVHYLTTGSDAATSTFADQVLATLEHVYSVEVGTMGFQSPPPDIDIPAHYVSDTLASGLPNPDSEFDVYLMDVGSDGLYGFCSPDVVTPTSAPTRQDSSFCVLDNDFARSQFGGVDPTKSLDVTAAHEFFHAIQFSYDVTQPRWLAEGTAVWMEDEVYNSINDYLRYVPYSPIRHPLVPFYSNGELSVYGDFTLFKFLSKYLDDPNTVREIWADIEARHDVALQAVERIITNHGKDPRKTYATFGAWNTLAPNTYPEAASYRPATFWRTATPRRHHTDRWSAVLAPLASAPVRLYVRRTLPRYSRLRVSIVAPRTAIGGSATVQLRYRHGGGSLVAFPLGALGRGTHTYALNPRKVGVVVITMTYGTAHEHPDQRFTLTTRLS